VSRDERSWAERVAAFVRQNYSLLLLDLVVLVTVGIIGSELLSVLGAPPWLQYVVLFLGVVVYTQLTPQWGSDEAD